MLYFVNAPPTKAELVPEGFNEAMTRPGYLVDAKDGKEAIAIAKAYRRGDAWTLDATISTIG